MAENVVALIARLGPSGAEVCVFEHPNAGVQLPAGTLHFGEDPIPGAVREGFEETGLDAIEVVGEPVAFDESRVIVPFCAAGPASDEWWVFTPDGGGLCWRCFWLPVEDVKVLNAAQRPWLEAAMPAVLEASLPLARRRAVEDPEVETDLTIEVFWAPPFPGDRAQISWLEPVNGPSHDRVGRSEVVAFTDEGLIIVQAEGVPPPYGLPGGRREAGETLEDTLRRELWEEACAELIMCELLGYQRFRYIRNGEMDRITTDAMYWARARCHEFVPRFETKVRALRTVEQVRAEPLFMQPLTARLLDRAIAAERRASFSDRPADPGPL